MLCTEIVSDIQNNFCTCSAKRRASDKDLPVLKHLKKLGDFFSNYVAFLDYQNFTYQPFFFKSKSPYVGTSLLVVISPNLSAEVILKGLVNQIESTADHANTVLKTNGL